MSMTLIDLNQTDKDKLNIQVYEYLRELSYYFEELEKKTKRYIPDYAVKHHKVFTIADVCEILLIVNKIYSLLDTGIYRTIKIKDDDTTNIRDWLDTYTTKTEIDLLYYYIERINTFKHYLGSIHNIDITNNNVIVTIFRPSGGSGELHKAIKYINSLKNKIKEALPDNYPWDCCEASE